MPFHSPVSGGGKVVDVKVAALSTEVSTTESIPLDDTIPQQDEGVEYMTLAITPKKTTNRLLVEFNCLMSGSAAGVIPIVALFRDSGANALQVRYSGLAGSGHAICVHMVADVVAGSVSETTFKIRFGRGSGGTVYMMQRGAGALFDAADHAVLRITEYEP